MFNQAKPIHAIGLVCLALLTAAVSLSSAEQKLRQRFTYLDSSASKPKGFLTSVELAEIYEKTATHPIAAINMIPHYDPTGEIGFCFGRALTAQLLARAAQLQPASMAKLFIIGALSVKPLGPEDAPEWRFHVTTLMRGPDQTSGTPTWFAIDPLMYRRKGDHPLSVDEWIHRVQTGWDSFHGEKPRTKLYLTPVSAVMPDIRILQVPEQGNRIIELNFDPVSVGSQASPQTHAQLGANSPSPIYLLPEHVSSQLFLSTNYPQTPAPFDFVGLDLAIHIFENGKVTTQNASFPYRNYFSDLFDAFQFGSGSRAPDSKHAGSLPGNGVSSPHGSRVFPANALKFSVGLSPRTAPPIPETRSAP